ncbi:hypothetical protein IF2G_00434 [Cordyceps javanica]|nr:hypothetical protein IF2G_00434 [Cordyceps javanica]
MAYDYRGLIILWWQTTTPYTFNLSSVGELRLFFPFIDPVEVGGPRTRCRGERSIVDVVKCPGLRVRQYISQSWRAPALLPTYQSTSKYSVRAVLSVVAPSGPEISGWATYKPQLFHAVHIIN